MRKDEIHVDASPAHYTKIYLILLVLLVVSVLGPELGVKAVTLVTAFGIAVVKAYLVIKHFMHLPVEKKYVGYLLTTSVFFMFLFFAGTSADVLNHRGRNWENVAAQAEVKRALEAPPEIHGGHGEHGGHEEAAGEHGEAHH